MFSHDMSLELEELPFLGPVLQLHYLVVIRHADSAIC